MIGVSLRQLSPTGTSTGKVPNMEIYTEDELRCLHRLIVWYRRRRQILADQQRDPRRELPTATGK